MKFLSLSTLLLVSGAAFADSIDFNFVSDPSGAKIRFDGGAARSVQFGEGSNGFDFVISHANVTSLTGLRGNIDGVFNIGAISTLGSLQTAPVTGTGKLRLSDGVGELVGDVFWSNISSFGTTLGLNVDGVINITNLQYTGSNAGLQAMKAKSEHRMTISTQFIPAKSLNQLMAAANPNVNTYSGTYNAVPEPATLAALGLGLAAAMRRKRK